LLLGDDEREIRPPDDLTFSIGESASLLLEKLHGGQQTVKVQLAMPKSKKHPVTVPEAVHTERLSYEIGLLKVAMFPGVLGIDVAKDMIVESHLWMGVAGSSWTCGETQAGVSAHCAL
jgi:carboxyl-terminal processing protease